GSFCVPSKGQIAIGEKETARWIIQTIVFPDALDGYFRSFSMTSYPDSHGDVVAYVDYWRRPFRGDFMESMLTYRDTVGMHWELINGDPAELWASVTGEEL